jgi:hypothetical protein
MAEGHGKRIAPNGRFTIMECNHEKIQCVRKGRGYVWSCALCGDQMLVWDGKVWETLGLDELEEGEGFNFSIVEGGRGVEDNGGSNFLS